MTPQRAELALRYAHALQTQQRELDITRERVTAAFERALAISQGTPAEVEARLRHADWALRTSALSDVATRANMPRPTARRLRVDAAEFTRLLELLGEALATAPHQSDDYPIKSLIESLRTSRAQLASQNLQLHTSPAYLPESRFAFTIEAQHLAELELKLFRIDLEALHDVAFGKREPTDLPRALQNATPLHTWNIETGIASLGRVTSRHSWREPLSPGAYALVARDTTGRVPDPVLRWFLVTNVQAFAHAHGDTLDICAFEQETGKPMPNVRGRVWLETGSHAFTTAEPGRAAVSLLGYTGSLRVIGDSNSHPFVIASIHRAARRFPAWWNYHLLADRPLYRPGETARWKVTARATTPENLRVPEGEKLTIKAKHHNGTELGTWTLTLNAFGSASEHLEIPASAPPGQVNFEISRASEADLGRAHTAHIGAFRIDNFGAPESTLTLEPADPDQIRRASRGDDVDLVLTARYFSGEPIAHASITVNVGIRPRSSQVPPEFRDPSESNPRATSPRNFEISTSTDARGEARVRLPMFPAVHPPAVVTIAAELTGEGTHSRAHLSFFVLSHGFLAELAPASQAEPRIKGMIHFNQPTPTPAQFHSLPQQPTKLALFTRDGRDAPLAISGEITVLRQTWDEVWQTPDGHFVTGEALRDQKRTATHWPPRGAMISSDNGTSFGWERMRSGYRSETVAKLAVTTDATGRASFDCPPLPAGCYRVIFHPEERNEEQDTPGAQLDLYVADASTEWLPAEVAWPQVISSITPQRPGQPIRGLVLLPQENRHALVSVAGVADGTSRLISIPGNTRLVEFPWQPGYWATARFSVSMLSDEHHGTVGFTVAPSRDEHTAIVTVLPQALASRPGETTQLHLRTTDHAGRPIASEVALRVADAAVAALHAGRSASISEHFLRPISVWNNPSARSARAEYFGSTQTNDPAVPAALEEERVLLNPFEVSGQLYSGYSALAGARGPYADTAAAIGIPEDPRVRGTFSYTAFWTPDTRTNARGEATVEFTYPDNLTAWKLSAESIGTGNQFGSAEAATQTTLPFQSRLRAPRALVSGDTSTLIGALVNSGPNPLSARAQFTSSSASVLEIDASSAETGVIVPGSGELLVSSDARALTPGEVSLRLSATGTAVGDAMEMTLPVHEDGFLQTSGVTGRATDRPLAVDFDLPEPLDPLRTTVALHVSPGIVPSLIDALPHLIDYPYGCVEQTMSRFLPAAIVAKLLRDLGFDAAGIERRIMRGSPAIPAGRARSAGLSRLDDVTAKSLSRLQEAQHVGGGFGWFPAGRRDRGGFRPGSESDPYMTAYVLRGLNVAAAAGINLPGELHKKTYESTMHWLNRPVDAPQSPARTAWILAAAAGVPGQPSPNAQQVLQRVFDALYETRHQLAPAGVALLAQTAATLNRPSEIAVLRRNLENGVMRRRSTELGETAQWGATADYFDGLEGAVETTALCLQALLAIDRDHPLADAAATWLLVNRQSGYWTNTRDTALAVLALHDYARARGDLAGDGSYRLTVNDRVIAEKTFDRDSLLAPASITLDPTFLRAGKNRIVLTRTGGKTPCFLVAMTRSWAQATTARPRGEFLTVARDYLRVVGQPTPIGTILPHSTPLTSDAAAVTRNDHVECRVSIKVHHDLEYVAIEVPKPGGCEPVNALSGWDATIRAITPTAGRRDPVPGRVEQRVYREEHDDRSVFFLPRLNAGQWEIRYTMRATFAGDYRALPATATAMYVPVIAGNSDARRLKIMAKAAD